ncbi:MAG TPA: hypothetical protein VK894_02755, partial [Jiangellales bacterium]|nr:hypothetical protein [Jiangellales bacterium]
PPNNPCVLISNVVYGLGLPADVLPQQPDGGVKAQTELAAQTLVRVAAGASNPSCNLQNPEDENNPCGIRQIAQLVLAGIPVLIDQLLAQIVGTLDDTRSLQGALGVPFPGCNPTATLRCASAALTQGAQDLAAGTNQLNAAAPALGSGVQQLAAGGQQLATGANDLSSGLRRLDAGGQQLAAGTGEAAAGGARLADGNQQLADGAGQLADGLETAADGSGQLADGLGTAAEGAPQIVDGAERLSVEGTSQLVEAGNATALDFGERFAAVEAATERAKESGMPYGAPDGATGTAAYSIEIAGADGEGSRNLGRGLLALALFGGVAGITAIARRGA